MIFRESDLKGAYIITLEAAEDERGSFTRTFCCREFAAAGLETDFVQHSISENRKRGTLRGLHYQTAPAAETKVVHCVRGSLFDVIVDLRPRSATYCQWAGFELSAGKGQLLYIPEGFAHGFQTLEDDTAIHYLISQYYTPELAAGVRWNDPAFGIRWPLPEPIMAEKDRLWPDYQR